MDKVCKTCNTSKPLEQFYVGTGKHGRRTYCKECSCKARREWSNLRPDYYRDRWLRNTYGVSLAEKKALLERQGGGCAICLRTTPTKTGWALDHDHRTGAVRAVLCQPCNSGLGFFNDDVQRVLAAARYLSG